MEARAAIRFTALVLAASIAGGCSSDGTVLSTASVAPPPQTAAAPKIDPACIAMTAHIDSLRTDGTVGRLEQAAEGKSSSVQVKRTALAKQAELNKANADFQAKCGPQIPKAQTASIVTSPGTAAATPATAQQSAVGAATPKTALAPKN